MNYFLFSVFILCLIAFVDVLVSIKKPSILRYNFLSSILAIFLIHFIAFNNLRAGFLFSIMPILNVVLGINLTIFINFLISQRIYNWVKINLTIAFFLASIFSFILFFKPSIFSFYNDSYTSFYILPEYWYLNILRFTFKILVIISIVRILYIFYKSTKSNNIYQTILRKWLNTLVYFQSFIFINFIILNFLNNSILSSTLFNVILTINAYVILLTIIYKPKFLSYHKFSPNRLFSFNRSISNQLTDDNFFIPFFNNQYYLQKEASIDRFCKENNIDDKEDFQDELIVTYKMSFNNLVNKYRVQYFLDIASTNKFNNYSIDALAQESGFSSRHHLYKPFKKFHGGTPSDFLYFSNDSLSS